MRKMIISVLLFAAPLATFAQLKVTNTGKVGIGITGTPYSDFAVGGVGSSSIANYFESNKSYLMNLKCIGDTATPSNFVTRTGVKLSRTTNTEGVYYGIISNMVKTIPSSIGASVGVYGVAGNTATNYGVQGKLEGTKKGAAILGQVQGNDILLDRKYAGYFAGDVGITKDLYTDGLYEGSDSLFLMGQSPLDSAMERLAVLNPVKWAWPGQVHGDDPRVYTRYAISGQNMKRMFPLLVREDNDAYHSVDYVGLIPVLVQAIKELNNRIAELEDNQRSSRTVSNAVTVSGTSGMEQSNVYATASLRQNTPNPFTERTVIRFTLPDNAQNAYIYIFDMTGKMQKQIPVDASMESVIINGYELSAGMYIYSLVINGKEMDTKRMILSK